MQPLDGAPGGGQSTGIFWPDMKAPGSSSGSAIGVGLGLAFASFGTETVSSLVSPSEKNCVVGLKPTSKLLPTDGVIPVSRRQDTLGYIARTVRDVAQIFEEITRFDSRQEALDRPGGYTSVCVPDGDLRGLRIGVIEHSTQEVDKPKREAFKQVLGYLKRAGAIIVENVSLAGLQEYESLPERIKNIVLETEFKNDMEEYLSSLVQNPRGIHTFEDLVHAVQHEPSEEYPERNVDIMLSALNSSKHSAGYHAMLSKQEYYAELGGFEGSMRHHNCDVYIAPAGSLILQAFASVGGNPVMTVPMGFYPEGAKVRRDKNRGELVSVALGIQYVHFVFQLA